MYCWGMYCAPMLLTLLTIENVSQSIYNLLLRHLDDQSSAVFALLAVFGSISAVLQCWPSLANVKHETLNPALDISIKPCIQVRFALQTLDAVCFVLQSIVRQTMTLLCTSQLPLLLHQLFPSPTFREIDRHLISVVGLVITIVVAVCLFRFSAKHVLSIQCAAMLSGYLCWASSSNEVPWIKAQFIILTAIGSIAIEATLVEYLLVHFQLPLTKWAAIQTFNIFLSCCLNLLFTRSNQDADILDISNTFSAIAANCSLLLSVFIVLLIVLRNK